MNKSFQLPYLFFYNWSVGAALAVLLATASVMQSVPAFDTFFLGLTTRIAVPKK
ncbi:hypothetical protein [Hymenobacter cellulosilyticus]|uniref:Uncharacterized protein n=1 Tax=Hymenobacter cellulosilyticus TaxID=2932248 RepID=A0A8T9Q2G4_9BACT|nr:hypothetical protein [Hymenobacter cellulosilyticus]UOQ70028.1 hypothetical protein MUN79_14675 [Hymenobacter cellulosilyticus]